MTPLPLSRRSFLRLLALSSSAFALSSLPGCQTSSGTTSSTTEGTGFIFTTWDMSGTPGGEAIPGYIQAYEQKQGVKITPVSYPYADYPKLMVQGSVARSISGAAQLDIASLASLAAAGHLRELDAVATGTGYTDAALVSGQVGGKQYGLPWTTASIGMVANQEILEQAGIDTIPSTTSEFEAALEKIKALDSSIIPYAAMTDVAQLKDIIPWIWTFGGTIIQDNEVTLGDEGSVAAVEWYKSLLDRNFIAPFTDRAKARQQFSQGKVAFFDDAILARGLVSKDSPIPDLANKVLPLARPTTGEGEPQALLWGHLIVVFNTDVAEPAQDFAKFLTSDLDTTIDYFKKASLPPTTESALAAAEVKNDTYSSDWTSKITKTARPHPFWPYSQSVQMEKALAEQVVAVLAGTRDAKAAMELAQKEIAVLMETE